MIRRKIVWLVVTFLMVLLLLSSCGVPREEHDTVVAERDDAQAQVVSLQSDLAAVESDLATVQTDLAAVEHDLAVVQNDLVAAENARAAAENHLAAIEAQIGELEAEKAELETQIAELEAEESRLEAQIAELEPGADILAILLYEPLSLDKAGNIIHIPQDYPRIQEGINAASDGDVVLVASGTYYENVDFLGKRVILTSEAGPNDTIIDGGQVGSVVTFWNREDSDAILHGFTITNGLVGWPFPFGGRISIRDSSPTISSCRIIRNGAAWDGGGLYVEGSEAFPRIENNAICNNFASKLGGGIEIRDGATPVVTNNTIIGNIAMNGSGVEIANNASPLIESNSISQNQAGWEFQDESAAQYLNGVDVINNRPSYTLFPCSVLVAHHCSPTIRNNNITENIGGGVSVLVSSSAVMESNSISGNRGNYLLAGGLLVALESDVELKDNLIKDNQNGAIWTDNTSSITGENFISGDVHIWPPSLGEEKAPTSNRTLLVPEQYVTIQEAIQAANNGDAIIVSPGNYQESIDFLGKDITLRSLNPDDKEIVELTIISAKTYMPTVTFTSGESRESKLEGFTILNSWDRRGIDIRRSSPTIANNIIRDCTGGGINCDQAPSPLITGNIIDNNEAIMGAGIVCRVSSPVITNNVIANNTAGEGGGSAIYTYFSSPTFINNTITNNQADGVATINLDHFSIGTIKGNIIIGNKSEKFCGGIYLDCFSNSTIDSNIIVDNQARPAGGIALYLDCYPEIKNNVIAGNNSDGIIVFFSSPHVVHNTIVDNAGFGIWAHLNSRIILTNSILCNNGEGDIRVLDDSYSEVIITYSDVMDRNWQGEGNISREPLLVGDGDYRLRLNSPCIDVGTDAGVYTDIEGVIRPQGQGFDMGAYEYVPQD